MYLIRTWNERPSVSWKTHARFGLATHYRKLTSLGRLLAAAGPWHAGAHQEGGRPNFTVVGIKWIGWRRLHGRTPPTAWARSISVVRVSVSPAALD